MPSLCHDTTAWGTASATAAAPASTRGNRQRPRRTAQPPIAAATTIATARDGTSTSVTSDTSRRSAGA